MWKTSGTVEVNSCLYSGTPVIEFLVVERGLKIDRMVALSQKIIIIIIIIATEIIVALSKEKNLWNNLRSVHDC